MDKLRKIGSWFWYNKERMVLAVMVIVLAYRVYGIVYPPESEVWPRIPVPQTELPQTDEEKQALGLPSSPPIPPTDGLPGPYTSLYEKNPFWYHASQAQTKDKEGVNAEDLNIELLDIQDVRQTSCASAYDSNHEMVFRNNSKSLNWSRSMWRQTVVIYSEGIHGVELKNDVTRRSNKGMTV